MPTPFQILADPVSLLIMDMYPLLMRLPPIPFLRCSCMKEQGMHCTGRNRKVCYRPCEFY